MERCCHSTVAVVHLTGLIKSDTCAELILGYGLIKSFLLQHQKIVVPSFLIKVVRCNLFFHVRQVERQYNCCQGTTKGEKQNKGEKKKGKKKNQRGKTRFEIQKSEVSEVQNQNQGVR
jgi:hypothetical protein